MLKDSVIRIKRKYLPKFAISLETSTLCWQHSCCSTKGYCRLYARMGVALRWWWHCYRQLHVCFTEYCSNFLPGRSKCSNSRPAKNLGRTSGITLEIKEFTGTWHVFLLVQKPWRRSYMLFSTIGSLVFCSDIPGLITELVVILRVQLTGEFSSMLPSES